MVDFASRPKPFDFANRPNSLNRAALYATAATGLCTLAVERIGPRRQLVLSLILNKQRQTRSS
jgi:hypothetical protein